jgi:hypothetical protein
MHPEKNEEQEQGNKGMNRVAGSVERPLQVIGCLERPVSVKYMYPSTYLELGIR